MGPRANIMKASMEEIHAMVEGLYEDKRAG